MFPRSKSDGLGELRAAVAPAHAELERRLDLISDSLTEERYADALAVLGTALAPVEQALSLHPSTSWSVEVLTPLIDQDLQSLGRPACAAGGIAPVTSPSAIDADAWWGAAYVLEGSRLGASAVARHLATVLPTAPRAYFDAGAAGGPARWFSFRLAARAALHSPDQVAVAVRAAVRVFESLVERTTAPAAEPPLTIGR